MNEIEIWVSPELADKILKGSVITIIASDKKKIGAGYVISGMGSIMGGSGEIISTVIEDAAVNDVVPDEKSGHSKEVVSVVVSESPKSNEFPVSEGQKLSFGERGPQLINGEETPHFHEEKEEKKPSQSISRNEKIIESASQLYDELAKLDPKDVEEVDVSGMSPDQRRELAVEMEKKGKIGCGFSAYVKNTCGGQLVISDIDVRIRHGDSFNLGKVSPAKLIKSVELFEAINGGLLEFVDAAAALEISRATDRRLSRMEEDIGSVEVYDNYEDVYDDINDNYDDDYDYDDRSSRPPSRRKAERVDNRFRKGIRTAGSRGGGHGREYADHAAVEAPPRFRGIEQENIMDGDDKYEFDRIFEDVHSREAEISSGNFQD